MYKRLFLGNKTIKLKEVNSTNSYLKELVLNNNNELEGTVVVTKNQLDGRGQKGTVWNSEANKNLTFSILLKPNTFAPNQFLISKAVSLGIVFFLENLKLENVKIKWPNDIYCNDKKIAGILIENSLKGNKVNSSIVGIGLNVNQIIFLTDNNPTSIAKELGKQQNDLDELLNQMLFFIERSYMDLKQGKEAVINSKYLANLYWINEAKSFRVGDKLVNGVIEGVDKIGKLQVKINGQTDVFGLKEIAFFK